MPAQLHALQVKKNVQLRNTASFLRSVQNIRRRKENVAARGPGRNGGGGGGGGGGGRRNTFTRTGSSSASVGRGSNRFGTLSTGK